MSLTRQQICELTSKKLKAAAPTLKNTKSVVGLDGFVDNIIAVVDKRHDRDNYEPVKTIDKLGDKVALPPVVEGDLIAIFAAGAYGASASPAAFLGHPPALELLLG